MESFLSHSADKFGRGTNHLCCVSESFWQRESFEKEGEGVLKVSVERVLSHSAQKIGRGTTLPFCAVFQKMSGSENVLKKRGKEYQKFQSIVFCLTVPKSWLGEQPFCAVFQRFSGSEKVLKRKGKEYQKFQTKVFCLTVPKNLVGEQPYISVLCFREFLASKKFYKGGGRSIESFIRKIFVSQCRKIW